MTGCDDNDSGQAKLFDAKQALDNGDWDKAIIILDSLGESEEVLQYLSNAYAGQVGINTFELLETIDELDNENSGIDKSGSIDMIGKLIGAEEDVLTCETISEKLKTISEAINKMEDIYSELMIDLDKDQTVQLGLASITRTVLIIAKLICLESGETEIKMTEEWLTQYYENHPEFEIKEYTWASIDDYTGESYQKMLNDDINNVRKAVDEMLDNNDIKDDFNQFMTEINNGNGGDNTDEITIDELNSYLSEM